MPLGLRVVVPGTHMLMRVPNPDGEIIGSNHLKSARRAAETEFQARA